MFLKIAFDTLAEESRLLIDTVKRSMIDPKSKNVVMKVEPNGAVSFLALTDIVVAKTSVTTSAVEVTEFEGKEPIYFQVPALTLEKLISTYAASELTTPLSVTFHPLTDIEVAITVQESLKLPDKDEEIRNSSLIATTPPFYVSDLYRLEYISVADNEEVPFVELTEQQREDMIQTLNDLAPYTPTTNEIHNDLMFNPTTKALEFYKDTYMPSVQNNMDFFLEEGGLRPMSLIALKDLLAKGLFSFYKDEEKHFFVLKQGATVIGVLYDVDVAYPPNSLDQLGDLPWVSLSRPLVEMYLKRINALSGLMSAERIQVIISDDLKNVTFKYGDLDLTAPIEHVHKVTEGNQAKLELGGFQFGLSPVYFDYLLYGKGEFADDIRFGFAGAGKFVFIKSFDSSNIWSVAMSSN
jgi:hypothetical protein